MTTSRYDGPKTATPEQLDDAIALANRVFRSKGGDMRTDYPLLYHPDRTGQLHIFTSGGKPVSLVGMVVSDVTLCGCSTRVACIGSVCTDPEHRGQGLAGRLVSHAADTARDRGVPVMLISGGRTLYQRRGATDAGIFTQLTAGLNVFPALGADASIAPATEADCEEALRLFEGEPARFRRTLEDYTVLATRVRETFLVRRSGELVAAVSLARPHRGTVRVIELAGSRPSALAAARTVAAEWGAENLNLRGYPWDRALWDACARCGIEPALRTFRGTVKLLDAERLWQDLQPLLAERIGAREAASIEVEAKADELKIHTVVFRRGRDKVALRGPQKLTATLFGHPSRNPLGRFSKPLAQTLRRALPSPLAMYGLNYV